MSCIWWKILGYTLRWDFSSLFLLCIYDGGVVGDVDVEDYDGDD